MVSHTRGGVSFPIYPNHSVISSGFYLLKQSLKSRSVLQDISRLLRLFGREKSIIQQNFNGLFPTANSNSFLSP